MLSANAFVEEGIDIPVAFQDVDDLESIVGITEEDDVAFVGDRPKTRHQLGPGSPQRTWQRRQLMAMIT